MNLPKEFEEYLRNGIVKKGSGDKPRAEFLIKESEISLEGLNELIEKIGVNDKNSNLIIKDSYDILMELIRAKMLLLGYSASGKFAHESEVSFFMQLNFTSNEVLFLNELRYHRNSITYYGKILDSEYAKKVLNFLEKVYPKLKKIISPL